MSEIAAKAVVTPLRGVHDNNNVMGFQMGSSCAVESWVQEGFGKKARDGQSITSSWPFSSLKLKRIDLVKNS